MDSRSVVAHSPIVLNGRKGISSKYTTYTGHKLGVKLEVRSGRDGWVTSKEGKMEGLLNEWAGL